MSRFPQVTPRVMSFLVMLPMREQKKLVIIKWNSPITYETPCGRR